MKRALINPERCHGCAECRIETNCANKAVIREAGGQKPWIDFYQCAGCMKCKLYCPHAAVDEIAQPCTGSARRSW